MEIEREVVDLYRALYMQSRIGARLVGTVTGLVGTGVFVAADDPFVDVLVRMESLGSDSYAIDDEGLRVIGARSGDRIALGDRMAVEVNDVSIARRTVYGKRIRESRDASADTKGLERPRRRANAMTWSWCGPMVSSG